MQKSPNVQKCTFCHKVFTCKTSLQKHLPKCKYQHSPLNKEDVEIIPKTEYLDENQILIVEMGEQTRDVTQLNDIKLENLETDIAEVSLPTTNTEELFVCSECNMAFMTLELAQDHILTSHSQ
ncbi:hypothetical protein LOTGIDRAFT_176798 [Lottia gigantea]|uniref:C2H2-type domain-containing protein n=1 Tax=Lottia gigantea TaxID=225164 RepID=V4A6U9_LOTGI|nr:hypothetical protein LOTGIDRAFT_176798 [Lottia gigantea]ESO90745.1 hypothetical protein LOTGIDRAFT_176798 [Lottia gigantea]